MPKIYIGCSGFHYKEWKDVFYPAGIPQSKWFQFYCEQFNTLEINTSFYKFPTPKSLGKWHVHSPADFKFSVKAPRLITHYKRFTGCSRYIDDFYNACKDGLGNKLGCTLFQLHPQVKYSPGVLQNIVSCLNPEFKNVLEFRHESWWNKSVYAALQKANITFSGISYPRLQDNIVLSKQIRYYRFHGVPSLYKSSYTKKFLAEKFNEISQGRPKEVWIYFNNTWGTAAIRNARYLQKILSEKRN